jgi:histidine ammonia-lyase
MIRIGNSPMTLEDFDKIVIQKSQIEIMPNVLSEVEASFNFIKKFSADKVIYGINTGFGPMAQFKIPYTDRLTLQYNLIRSHASGTGNPISPGDV